MRVVVNHEDDIDVDDTLIIVVISVDVATVIVSLFNVVRATNESLAVGSQGIVKFWKSYPSNNVIAPRTFSAQIKNFCYNFQLFQNRSCATTEMIDVR